MIDMSGTAAYGSPVTAHGARVYAERQATAARAAVTLADSIYATHAARRQWQDERTAATIARVEADRACNAARVAASVEPPARRR